MSDFEAAYWGSCVNTFDEEQKHWTYARCMGLDRAGYSFDVRGASVIDIGGGPVSMLLKTVNLGRGLVVDPLEWPPWVYARYAAGGIEAMVLCGEDLDSGPGWDEAWLYNVLQHTDDPAKVVANARRAARLVRLFEWVDIPPHEGHPHMLTVAGLREWLDTDRGDVGDFAADGCYGRAFFGAFPGDRA